MNVGSAPLAISAVRLAYGDGLFSLVAKHCGDDTTLEPGQACQIRFRAAVQLEPAGIAPPNAMSATVRS